MRVETIGCDAKNCQELKRESNNWWVVLEHPSGVFVTTAELIEEGVPALFDRDGLDGFKRHDACSEACLRARAWRQPRAGGHDLQTLSGRRLLLHRYASWPHPPVDEQALKQGQLCFYLDRFPREAIHRR